MIALQQDRRGVATRLRTETHRAGRVDADDALAGDAAAGKRRRLSAAICLVRRPNARLAPGRTGVDVARYAIWRREAGQWRFAVQPARERVVSLAPQGAFGRPRGCRGGQCGGPAGQRKPRVTVVLP
jgi:hypothetical protein